MNKIVKILHQVRKDLVKAMSEVIDDPNFQLKNSPERVTDRGIQVVRNLIEALAQVAAAEERVYNLAENMKDEASAPKRP